jgi:hypothetical protein
MRTRRRFQPMLYGLPVRIAPSAVVAVAPVVRANAATVSAYDSDTAQEGVGSQIILAPPPGSVSPTLFC